jgi:transcriptional regulator with XRE-family HTH domain
MRSTKELLQLKEQAIALRRAGKSRRQIKEALGSMSNTTLSWALQGEPPPEWTRRPNAKDEVRAKARELREQGLDYEEIADVLGVSKGSVSLWVRDMPTPPHLTYEESRKRSAEGVRRYWAAERPVREAARKAAIAAAARDIGDLSGRELLIAGAIAYWCEGAKGKPRQRSDRVVFINSDPGLIRFFLRFLEAAGVERNKLTYRVYIHESADIPAAERFWAEVADANPTQLKRSVVKRHNPKTVRKNVGADYHGCLVVDVPHSAELYQKIEGWAWAAMCAQTENDDLSN